LNQRPLRPEGSGVGSQVVDSIQLRESQNSACPRSCLNCRQAETNQDNSGQDADVLLRSVLEAVQVGDDSNNQRKSGAKGTGKSLLEVIRLLAEMDPGERTALIRLLKAMG